MCTFIGQKIPIAINWADLWHWISPIDIFFIQLDYTAQYAYAAHARTIFDRTAQIPFQIEEENKKLDDKRFRFCSIRSFVFGKQWEMVRNGFWVIEKKFRKKEKGTDKHKEWQ